MSHASRPLIEALRAGLATEADPERAPRMQAYMKSALPYHGVPSPACKRIFREAIAAHPLPDFEVWRDTALVLWRDAAHREEWYAALAVLGHRRYREHRTREALPLYEELIVTGAWWDVVDELASHRLGELLTRDRAWLTPWLRAWAVDPHLWKRRAAILAQLGQREDTDVTLLAACIEPNLDDRDFFIRKAIGWALRQHARTDPDWVRAYVEAHAGRLSGLSRREARKHLATTPD